jgi:hypothetical protein
MLLLFVETPIFSPVVNVSCEDQAQVETQSHPMVQMRQLLAHARFFT